MIAPTIKQDVVGMGDRGSSAQWSAGVRTKLSSDLAQKMSDAGTLFFEFGQSNVDP